MKQIVSIARNLSIQIDKYSDKKETAGVTPVAEVIVAHTDGKNYSINEAGETARTTKIKEARFHVTPTTCRSLIEFLEGVEKELKAWGEDEG